MRPPSRRDALKLLAASAVVPACGRQDATHAFVKPVVLGVHPLPAGAAPWPTPDPFLFCVHHDDRYPAGNAQLGPAASLAGRQLGRDFAGLDGWRMYHGDTVPGFPAHPHRGFETITVVRRGLLDHSDSLGATARYGGGDVQWLTAGAGILHAEMFPLLDRAGGNPVEMFQIWLNLPRADKLAAPHFTMLWSSAIPRQVVRDARGRATKVAVVAGRYDGLHAPPPPPPSSWAARADTDVAVWTLELQPGARWTLPAAQATSTRWLYFFAGSQLRIGEHAIGARHAIEVRADAAVDLEAGGDTVEILVLQGRPIGEPVVQRGPFVMTTQDEIRATIADYQRTRFGGWRWSSPEPVHGAEPRRFARLADGTLLTPA